MEWVKGLFKKYKRLIIYTVVGGINTAVDFLVFFLLHNFTPLGNSLSQGASYMAGVISSFILNRGVTFRDGEKSSLALQLARFLAVNAVSLAVSMWGIELLVGAGLHAYIAKVCITFITMAINYFGYKLLVFKVRDK